MKENVGWVDQMARWVAGPALMSLGYRRLGGRAGRKAGLAAMVGGALVLESAVTRVCPLNALAGVDSRSPGERRRDLRASLNEVDERGAVRRAHTRAGAAGAGAA